MTKFKLFPNLHLLHFSYLAVYLGIPFLSYFSFDGKFRPGKAAFSTCIILYTLLSTQVLAQELSTEGKDFWVGYLTN